MIRGKKILLRAMEMSDVDILYKWENDTVIWHLGNIVTPFSKYTLEQYVKNSHQDIYTSKQLRLMIALSSTDTPVGCIDLFDYDPSNNRAGVGILISHKHRDKGYASEALGLLIEYSFKTLNLNQLYCNIISSNKTSLKLFQKFKFKITGLKKKWIRIGNKWEDEYTLQLINE